VTRLSVVVLSWNTRDLLRSCLRAIFASGPPDPLEVIVVDNASEDGSADAVAREFPEVVLVRNAVNEGYARGNNIGLRRCRGDYLLLLNSDTEVRPGALQALTAFLDENPDHGACGSQLLNPDGTLQRACMRFPGALTLLFFDTFLEKLFPENPVVRRYFMRDFDHASSRDVDQPPGACFLLRRAVVDRVGYLDEELFLFYSDVDYCKRIREAGWRIRFGSESKVMHHGGASTRRYRDFGLEWHRNRVAYFRKHYGLAGEAAAKAAALLKGVELAASGARRGKGLRSPETRQIWRTVKTVLLS